MRFLKTKVCSPKYFPVFEKLISGEKYTMSWWNDYKKYFDESNNDFDFDFHSDSGVADDLGPLPKTGYDLRYMKSFLDSPVYHHYLTTLRLNNITTDWKKMRIEKFTMTLVYAGIKDWQGRIDIMVKWREIAKRYETLGAVVWETNAMFVDQMLTMKTFSLQSGALTLACMFVVCAIFIQTPIGVFTAVFSIGSIAVGVVGYLYYWGLVRSFFSHSLWKVFISGSRSSFPLCHLDECRHVRGLHRSYHLFLSRMFFHFRSRTIPL